MRNFGMMLWTLLVAGAALALCASTLRADDANLPVEEAVLLPAPQVPPPITRNHPAKVVVHLEVKEFVGRLADGVQYNFWGFGGTVPGPLIRLREGDLVEFHLSNNPGDKLPHNIDMHAVTGPGGGAVSSFTAPGHTSTFSFRTLKHGLYVYHCATAPVGMHIANGMYGLVLVEPSQGLPHADREYYVMQSEFYTAGRYGEPGLQPFSMEKALEETPEYVVFDGSVGALVGDNALRASVGDTVRLFVGNIGPNLVSSFHVIGEIFDTVNVEAGNLENHNVQTTLIPAGGAATVTFKTEVPGTYILVDHSIFRAFNKGALGMLKVGGPEDKDVYSGKLRDDIYQPEGQVTGIAQPKEPAPTHELTKAERIKAGELVFNRSCYACHQPNGQGLPGVFPPLAQSDYLKNHIDDSIAGVIKGRQGPLTVNGKPYNQVMPPQNLSDDEIASVMTFILNSWGNEHDMITPDQVKKVRDATP